MPDYPNVHKVLDNGQIHKPRDYSLAGNATFLGKDINGELAWDRMTWDAPVIGFISDESTASSADGARYIVTASSTASFSGAAVNDVVEYLTVDYDGNLVNEWNFISPIAGCTLYASSVDTFYYFDGSIWKDLIAAVTPTDKDNATVTLDGGTGNGAVGEYVDLFTPAVGKIFEAVLLKSTGLLPADANISVVLHDGTPANDVEIMPAISTAELDGVLFKYGCNGEVVSGGYSLKLLITGNTVTAGTVTVVANYLI